MIRLLGKIPHKVSVAVSGGLDSMVILDFLNNGKNDIDVLHFDHGTKFGSTAKEFVVNYCSENGIPYVVGQTKSSKMSTESWEEYWRNERYSFFKENNKRPIVTAHHLNDIAEWWIFSSLHGKAKIMPYENGAFGIIRPFLITPKKELEQWSIRNGVPYVQDPSNESRRYMRNIIRHDIMPTATVVNPGLHKVLKKKVLEMFEDISA